MTDLLSEETIINQCLKIRCSHLYLGSEYG